jgi:hypothetical protein
MVPVRGLLLCSGVDRKKTICYNPEKKPIPVSKGAEI